MCCGTAQNSYKTLKSLRLILADGSLLDTGDETSRQAFAQTHEYLLNQLAELGRRTREDTTLAERIRNKFKIKNTCGYSLNALVDFEDPFEIMQHLMIGSEGTLGFMAEITYHTVDEHTHKATALMILRTTLCFRAVQSLAWRLWLAPLTLQDNELAGGSRLQSMA